MNDIWICPHCGYENEDTERIALKELCRRCKEDRKTAQQLEEYINTRLEDLDDKKGDVVCKLDAYDESISEKKHEIQNLKERRSQYEQEYHRIEMEQIKLKSKIIYTERIKNVYKDQRRINEF